MVEGGDVNGVLGSDCVVLFFVIEDEREYVIEFVRCIDIMFYVLLFSDMSILLLILYVEGLKGFYVLEE